ncbi:hypothetical protein [Aliiroseovarius sp. 2305UL8-7]|uniref:hypothetical protein n=1 Tax=Aliiroseovarius conchicola TaxID=3121637 RepID=UPI003527C79D
MKYRVFGAIAMATVMFASAASATVYECNIKAGPYIPPVMIITDEDGKIGVFDGLIRDVYGAPIKGKLAVDNAKRATYSWKVKGFKATETNSGRTVIPKLSFRLTRQKSSNAAKVQVKAVGYKNTFRSSGKCKIAK